MSHLDAAPDLSGLDLWKDISNTIPRTFPDPAQPPGQQGNFDDNNFWFPFFHPWIDMVRLPASLTLMSNRIADPALRTNHAKVSSLMFKPFISPDDNGELEVVIRITALNLGVTGATGSASIQGAGLMVIDPRYLNGFGLGKRAFNDADKHPIMAYTSGAGSIKSDALNPLDNGTGPFNAAAFWDIRYICSCTDPDTAAGTYLPTMEVAMDGGAYAGVAISATMTPIANKENWQRGVRFGLGMYGAYMIAGFSVSFDRLTVNKGFLWYP